MVAIQRGQRGKDRSSVGRNGRGRYIEPSYWRRVFDTRGIQSDLVYLPNDLIGSRETGTRWQLDDDGEVADILVWNEAGTHPRHYKTG